MYQRDFNWNISSLVHFCSYKVCRCESAWRVISGNKRVDEEKTKLDIVSLLVGCWLVAMVRRTCAEKRTTRKMQGGEGSVCAVCFRTHTHTKHLLPPSFTLSNVPLSFRHTHTRARSHTFVSLYHGMLLCVCVCVGWCSVREKRRRRRRRDVLVYRIDPTGDWWFSNDGACTRCGGVRAGGEVWARNANSS